VEEVISFPLIEDKKKIFYLHHLKLIETKDAFGWDQG
jgi:hypothetical protein